MRTIDEIIGRAENLLCIMDRRGVECKKSAGKYYTRKERENQRLLIYEWLKKNGYDKYMTGTEKFLFEKKVGNPFIKEICRRREYEHEAIEPLLWTLGLTKCLTTYSRSAFRDFQDYDEIHYKLKVHVPNTHEELLKRVVLRSEEEVELRDQIAMLWYWRAIEWKNPIFKKEPIGDILIEIFGDAYRDAIDSILRGKGKQDFKIYNKYVYQCNSTELRHLYQRAKWRYHAFEWLLTEEDWDNISLNT